MSWLEVGGVCCVRRTVFSFPRILMAFSGGIFYVHASKLGGINREIFHSVYHNSTCQNYKKKHDICRPTWLLRKNLVLKVWYWQPSDFLCEEARETLIEIPLRWNIVHNRPIFTKNSTSNSTRDFTKYRIYEAHKHKHKHTSWAQAFYRQWR